MLQSRNLLGGKSKYFWSKSKYFLAKSKYLWMLTKVLIPAVLRSEWMFSCSCERCSDPAQADMGTHMSSFSCGCGGFYTARQTCRRWSTIFGKENNNTEGRYSAFLFLKCESIISKVYFIQVEGASRCNLWMLYF